ncbi:General secretion pathway protein K [Roseovarius litorisediminis]|uniref:Type II secretion system protein K n=1 Tax=Roseovarius litorisediminis TaxID=1312363 RepID=A0A1Y5STG4_9RHOB|nr:type II secretion system minor pseudopilin GspK [Roseovarius litorisediminis]SLN47729.1 General secretion pathway protein K [Roseovarius litorisediminis]
MDGQRGIALLNALVMVAAISAVASGLMLRAETSRTNLFEMRAADQAGLYLDAAELLVEPVLQADWAQDQSIDHLRESWATETFEADIDRGQISGKLQDLQGLFNINCLSDPADVQALQAFDRLLRSLDVPVVLARETASFVQARGPVNLELYTQRELPVRPPNGPVQTVEELRLIQGMTEQAYLRLRPYVSALSGCSAINMNTAPRLVLAALLPTANPGGLDKLLEERDRLPFSSSGDFRERAEKLIHGRVIEQSHFPLGGVSVKSNWFQAEFTAQLDDTTTARQLIVERSSLTGKTELTYRSAVLP